MKVVKQGSAVATLNAKNRTHTQLRDIQQTQRQPNHGRIHQSQPLELKSGKASGLSLQLNRQLSSMQSAQAYLGILSEQLSVLKHDLGLRRNVPQTPFDNDLLSRSLNRVNALLDSRVKLAGGVLDARFTLSLNQPPRSLFSLEGLGSLKTIQGSGKEVLLFNAGRHWSAPVAVVLDDDMSEAQILRRFNSGLGQAGLHAELSDDARLKFSAPEQDWQRFRNQLSVQGEGKLFARGQFSQLASKEDNLLGVSLMLPQSNVGEYQELFESIEKGLERVVLVNEQLNRRQADVREFLARQESREEKRWVHDFAGSVLRGAGASGYALVAQTVLSQSNITRFSVVGMLS